MLAILISHLMIRFSSYKVDAVDNYLVAQQQKSRWAQLFLAWHRPHSFVRASTDYNSRHYEALCIAITVAFLANIGMVVSASSRFKVVKGFLSDSELDHFLQVKTTEQQKTNTIECMASPKLTLRLLIAWKELGPPNLSKKFTMPRSRSLSSHPIERAAYW
jgi:hypothetical protein